MGWHERREAAGILSTPTLWIRTGFRVITPDPIAGGPVELAFFIENLTAHGLRLGVGSDRNRQRPAQFRFDARFQGIVLEDPMAAVPDFGGRKKVVDVTASNAWHQPLLLNMYLSLEATARLMGRDAVGRLDLTCTRPITLATTDEAALSPQGEQVLSVDLCFSLRHDPMGLATLSQSLLDKAIHGPPPLRERPLAMLLAMRSAARPQIEILAEHQDPMVTERARQVLGSMT